MGEQPRLRAFSNLLESRMISAKCRHGRKSLRVHGGPHSGIRVRGPTGVTEIIKNYFAFSKVTTLFGK